MIKDIAQLFFAGHRSRHRNPDRGRVLPSAWVSEALETFQSLAIASRSCHHPMWVRRRTIVEYPWGTRRRPWRRSAQSSATLPRRNRTSCSCWAIRCGWTGNSIDKWY